MRLDLYLSKNNYCESRNKATSLIVDGFVTVNGNRVAKPSYKLLESDVVEIISDQKLYVARSAKKLLTAIEVFGVDFKSKTVVDLGASTGGFCEVMLENSVSKIYAVDIGSNQLHPSIKSDPKVVNMEHTNARYLSAADFDDKIDIVTCDLSFISLTYILNAAFCILSQDGEAICLIKPQFEVGAENLSKNGVVKEKELRLEAVKKVANHAIDIGFSIVDIAFSGLSGESGNKEYLLYLKKSHMAETFDFSKISDII